MFIGLLSGSISLLNNSIQQFKDSKWKTFFSAPSLLFIGFLSYLSFLFLFLFAVSGIMSTAKRLVLSLAGRNESQNTTGASSTRLFTNNYSPGHELDEIAIVSNAGTDTCRNSYGSLTLNGPRYIPGQFIIFNFS